MQRRREYVETTAFDPETILAIDAAFERTLTELKIVSQRIPAHRLLPAGLSCLRKAGSNTETTRCKARWRYRRRPAGLLPSARRLDLVKHRVRRDISLDLFQLVIALGLDANVLRNSVEQTCE